MKIEDAVKHLTPDHVKVVLNHIGMLDTNIEYCRRHSAPQNRQAYEAIRDNREEAMILCMEEAGEREDSGVVIKWIPYAVPFPNCNWCNEPAIGGVRQRRLDGIALETAYCESCVTQLSGVLTARKIPV